MNIAMPTNLLNVLATGETDGFMMPSQSSSIASEIDLHFYLIFWIAAFFFVLIISAMLLFCIRYRRRASNPNPPQADKVPHHNTPLEIVWSLIPAVGLMSFFAIGFVGYVDMRTPPPNAYVINVNVQSWTWRFTYPTGQEPLAAPDSATQQPELHVPPNEPIHLRLTSDDDLHALFIPDMRVKMDIVPGRYSDVWFIATKPGTYRLFCAEYCGEGHSKMHTVCVVHESREDYLQWLAGVKPDMTRPLWELGRDLVHIKRGCGQCHSVDGSAGTGPTFQGIWGRTESFTDGSSLVIDGPEGLAYVRESIYDPKAKVVAGYQPVMPSFRGRVKGDEIIWLVEYLRYVSDPEGYLKWLEEQGGAVSDGDGDAAENPPD